MFVFVLMLYVSVSHALDSWVCSANTDAFVTSSKHLETEKRLQALELQVQQLQKLAQHHSPAFSTIEGIPRDARCPFFVYCDMTHGGWTVIQKHVDDSVNFYRDWNDYVAGFGNTEGSHWLGLEKIHRLTRDGSQIYFDVENYDGTTDFAHYKVFTVQGAITAYTMNVDAFGYDGSIKEVLSFHNGMKFSTYDRENDASTENCSTKHCDGGGWWFKDCWRLGNVNGVYGKRDSGGINYWDGKAVPFNNVQIRVKRMLGTC